jgi:outer membrane receptor protein involved in Fe transport
VRFVSVLLRLWVVGVSACAAGAVFARSAASHTGAEAQEKSIEFNLPAQPAPDALLAFAKQANVEVLFSFKAMQDKQSKPVTGSFKPEDALNKLLDGTGYAAKRNGEAKFVVAPLTKKTGSIRGRFLDRYGNAARGVRVVIPATTFTTTTNYLGEFQFPALDPGTYAMAVSASGYQSLHLTGLEVEPDTVLTIPTKTLSPADDPSRLAPYVVKDHLTRHDPFDRSEAQLGPRTAGSNLDLARTENDALPFNIYNRDQIARSGVVNLNEFLQRELLDANALTSPPEQDGTQAAFMAGSTNLSLRGFSSDQTIILVNGRRLPETLINQTGAQAQAPDVNFIPLSLVQQVEVLPVSAASLYSGNAVGGIINIVLRPAVDSEATEVALTYTNATDNYDASQSSMSLLHSRSLLGGKLRVRFNASFARATSPIEAELGYRRRNSLTGIRLTDSLYRATPNIRSLAVVELDANGVPRTDVPAPPPPPLFGPGTATVTSVAPGADGNGGLAAFSGRQGVRNFALFDTPGGFSSSLESIDYTYGRQQVRGAYFASAVFDPLPWLQLSLDGTYTRSVLHRGYDVISADLRLRAESPFNPFHQEANVSLNETTPLLGESYNEARLEFGAVVFSALFKLPRDWRVLLDTQYGQNLAQYRGIVGADYPRWQKMVDEGRYNPLRDTQVFGPPQEFYDRVLIYRGAPGRFITLGNYSTFDAALRATHHDFKLPTGSGALNVGVDYRRNYLAKYNDERKFADGTLAAEPIRFRGRALERYSIFGETQAPLVPRTWLPSGIRRLDTDIAVRYIASNLEKEATYAPTFALKMQLPAGFTLRGSISTSNRFPTPQMARLATSGTGKTVAPVDVRQVFDPQVKQTYTVNHDEFLNPDLNAEEALTQTAGVLFRSGHEHRFRAALDFVDTRKINELTDLSPQTILNLERFFPDRVVRDPATGQVTNVITGTINSAKRRSENWNGSLDYAWTECFGGTLEAYGRLIYFSRYDHQLVKGADLIDEISHPEGASPVLKYRAKFGASWSNRDFGAGVDGHYFHSRILPLDERESQGRDRISPFWQADAFIQGNIGHWLSWLPNGLRAQVRVNNLFATPYPRYATAGSGTGVQAYGDWRGRVYSLSLTTTF